MCSYHYKTGLLRMTKPIYGLKDAPRAWCKRLYSALLQLGGHALHSDGALYAWNDKNGLLALLLAHVDDLKIPGEGKTVQAILAGLTTQFGVLKVQKGNF